MTQRNRFGIAFALLAGGVLFAMGCGKNDGSGTQGKDASQKTAQNNKEGQKHGEWWCGEHGIPEEECSMCSNEVAAAFKAKGDWCDKHDRAKSQCFICDPSLKEKYATKYRAKYGKEPPPIEE